MADGELTVRLDDRTLRRLKADAESVGMPLETYAADLLSHSVPPQTDFERAETGGIIEAYERTGVSYSVEEGLAAFDAAVKRRFSPE
jgi:hypothetical protein